MSTPNPPMPRAMMEIPAPAGTPQPEQPSTKPGRWQLVAQLRSSPARQQGFSVFLGWWCGATVTSMVAAIDGGFFVALIVGGVNLAALVITLLQWKQLNTGILVATNAVTLGLLSASQLSFAPIALVSIALMFAAAQAGQVWWYQMLDEQGTDLVGSQQSGARSSVEVLGIAVAAAAIALLLSLFNTRFATVAALVAFTLIALLAWLLSRPPAAEE